MNHTDPTEDQTRVWKMLADIDICMLVTHQAGTFGGRPMSTIPRQDDATVYLLTDASTTAVADIEANSAVFLSYQGGGDHVSLTGTATVIRDTALVENLWTTGAKAFWPDGPKTPGIVVLAVRQMSAEYWDGHNPVVSAAKVVYALATGSEPDLGLRGHADLG